MLPPGRGETYLDRFRREARTAARLHHTNIVPVFGVVEADGVHYFALGVKQGFVNLDGPVTVRVEASGFAPQEFTDNPPGVGTQWGDFRYDFVAVAPTTDLSFVGITGKSCIGLDDVRVAPVPEPASALLVGGLAATAVAAVRSRIRVRVRSHRRPQGRATESRK